MIRASIQEYRLRRVCEAFATLPQRYQGCDGRRGVCEIRLTDIHRSWRVELDSSRCRVEARHDRKADVLIETDAGTWLALREGKLSGLDAYARRRLRVSGDIDLAVAFEGFFELPGGRPPKLRMNRIQAGKATISTLSTGEGSATVVLIHGLASNKSSFYETVPALARRYRVHAIDMPGFGYSSKPLIAAYDAPWFARAMRRWMDAMGIERAHLVGNSLGGRVAIELALTEPDRVASLSLLAPSMAWRRRRELVPLLKLLRPELSVLPHQIRPAMIRRQFEAMFARPERIDSSVAELALEEFCSHYRSRAARMALYTTARNIPLEEPFGPSGFWTRLAGLKRPTMFVWGDRDRLSPAGFARHVGELLPDARMELLEECGHAPQIELPGQTNRLLLDFIGRYAAKSDDKSRALETA